VNRRWHDAAALLLLLVLDAGIFWKLTLTRRYTWLENPDQGLQVRPWLDYEAREIHAGRIPLWDPDLVAGQSLIGQVQPGLANPVNWILFAMPLRNGHIALGVLHWYWVLIHWLAAAFCYWLCRDVGAGPPASLVGASIFAFAGFIGHSATPQFLMSAMWGPLVVLFFARVFRGERPVASGALSGAALGLALLSGHHNIPTYTAVVMAGLWGWLVATRWRDRRVWMAAAAFGLLVFLVSAVQILPAVEYGRQALRWAGAPDALHWNDRIPYGVHAEFSLYGRSIPGFVIPGLMVHANPFVGVVAVTFALAAIALAWGSRTVKLLAAVTLGSLLLALGADSPLHRLAYLLFPMVEKARYPAFAIAITQVGVAALAALGLEAVRENPRVRGRLALWPAGFGIAVFAVFLVLRLVHHAAGNHPAWVVAAIALAFGAVLWRGGRALAPAALVLCVAESLTLQQPIQQRKQPNSYENLMEAQSDIADYLKAQPGWFRVEFDADVVPYNFGEWHGVEQFNGYAASMLERTHRVLGSQESLRYFGVRYRVAAKPKPGEEEAFRSRSGITVWRRPGIGDPVWAEYPATCSGETRIRLAGRVAAESTIEAALPCRGLLVVGDPYYRGWRAWVDGRRTPIREYAGVIRAVDVPAGRHRVEFRYRPASVYAGAGLTALGFLLAAAAFIPWDRVLRPRTRFRARPAG